MDKGLHRQNVRGIQSTEFLTDVNILGNPLLQFCFEAVHGHASPNTCGYHVVVTESPLCKADHFQRCFAAEEIGDAVIGGLM